MSERLYRGVVTDRMAEIAGAADALLLVVVTFISLLVHIFSTDYVAGDRRYTHYFGFLSLFTASMGGGDYAGWISFPVGVLSLLSFRLGWRWLP